MALSLIKRLFYNNSLVITVHMNESQHLEKHFIPVLCNAI